MAARAIPFGLEKVALHFPVRKWPDTCQSLPNDGTTPVEKGGREAQRANRKPGSAAAWRLLYLFNLFILIWF
jgi:hypothetical protein